MASHVLSVCIFCFICATHSPCASHAAVSHTNANKNYHLPYDDASLQPVQIQNIITSRQKRQQNPSSENALNPRKTNISVNNNKNEYVKKIFDMFSNGEDSMNVEEFEKLLNHLDLMKDVFNKFNRNGGSTVEDDNNNTLVTKKDEWTDNKSCVDKSNILNEATENKSTNSRITYTSLTEICPAILYSLVAKNCDEEENHVHNHEEESNNENNITYVWLYSIGAVIITSACGVLALAIIPVMQKRFYQPLIQFLVALAVGTLAGDALLHLLPHAMTEPHSHDSHDSHIHLDALKSHDNLHDQNMWKGFVAMMGLTFFFFMERLILMAGKWRKQKHKKHGNATHVNVLRSNAEKVKSGNNETQCMDRYNPYPYCYKDILNGSFIDPDLTTMTVLDEHGSNSDTTSYKKSRSTTMDKIEDNQNDTACPHGSNADLCTQINKMFKKSRSPPIEKENKVEDHLAAEINLMLPELKNDHDITVILREHGTNHHGHSHSHGHVHGAPTNLSSVAWMVIMGDGLHNFTDGMAIGAAFSGSLAGGFSTAVAVFCHELPHELGDFAMLLKAGMTIRQAIFYNLLSSVLCVLGNILGIWLGNTESASSWVFAAAAGMFLYIALVDMIPELSSAHENESNIRQCLLHLSGLLMGFGIMTVIALYEGDLKTLFNESN